MSTVDLLNPILDEQLRRGNFFNGRLLSAEDLRAEQDANRTQQRRLARALGGGVAWGLAVSISQRGAPPGPGSTTPREQPQLKVEPGAALNRSGDLLYLHEAAQVTLVPGSTATAVSGGLFADCGVPPTAATYTGEGAYVLTVAPMSQYDGTALVSDPNATALGRGACGARYAVPGVFFRLVPIDFSKLPAAWRPPAEELPPADERRRERLRSRLAHLCFGTDQLGEYFQTPLARTAQDTPRWAGWGLLDALDANHDLTSCDVPLAVVVMTSTGISFVDAWSARRRLLDAGAVDDWLGVAGPRRVAEAEAAFLQFQQQLAELPAALAGKSARATELFYRLPPAARLPVAAAQLDWRVFLGVHAPPQALEVDAALLRGYLQEAWLGEPFDPAQALPVPLHVYRLPANNDFVVYARSRRGNIRVRLNPWPSGSQQADVVATSATGEVRRGVPLANPYVMLVDVAPGSHRLTVETGSFDTPAARTVSAIGGVTIDDAGFTLNAIQNGSMLVSARDRDTGEALTSAVVRGVSTTAAGVEKPGIPQGSDRWLISGLPAGDYTLAGVALGYQAASLAGVHVTSGAQASATLEFRKTTPEPPEPDPDFLHPGITTPALGKTTMTMVLAATEFSFSYFAARIENKLGKYQSRFRIESRADSPNKWSANRYVSPTGEIVYRATNPWAGYLTLAPETPQLVSWLQAWRTWLAFVFADNALLAVTPHVLIDSTFQFPKNAQTVPSSPPAYAVFGAFGVPLILKSEAGKGRKPKPLDESKLHDLDREHRRVFEDKRLWRMDDLAFIWQEVVVDITHDPVEFVKESILERGEEVQRVNEEREYYPGVDKDVSDELDKRGYTTDVDLANADPAVLTEVLGSKSHAGRVLQTARSIAPAESWSLQGMGFTQEQVTGFQERGIDSKGALVRAAGSDQGKADIAQIMGVEGADRDRVVARVGAEATRDIAEHSVATHATVTVTAWKDMDQVTGATLQGAGFASVEEVAGASAEELASKTGLSAEEATQIQNQARGASIAGKSVDTIGGLSSEERTGIKGILSAAGEQATLGAFSSLSAEQLAPAFSGNQARAEVFLKGVQAGMQQVRG